MTTDQFRYFVSLFRSRSDVYARHWQKGMASGYSPAYQFDWSEFNAHRARGGKLSDFANKQTAPLTMRVFMNHVSGELAAGVYPILPDNTCCFLAADFDGRDWIRDCQKYIEVCQSVGLSAYLERSKSGKGGHVWIFFSDAYPCYKARRIGMGIIQRSLQPVRFSTYDSFDRLFPNQDLMPQGGYGNLIALPLQGKAVLQGNTVFLNPVTEQPYNDQWGYVQQMHQHTPQELDAALEVFEDTSPSYERTLPAPVDKEDKLNITVDATISLPRSQLNAPTVAFLREKLSFLSIEYLTKKRLGKPTYDVQKYFQLIEETPTHLRLPRGFLPQLTDFLNSRRIGFEIVRRHGYVPPCAFDSHIALHEEQQRMIEIAQAQHEGILVAPPGSGKTMMAMELAARLQKPTLILVHRRQLLDQWVERIQTYLNIPQKHIGTFSGHSKKIGDRVTVASIQSLARYKNIDELTNMFGTIIIDECHHIPAKTFRAVIARFNPERLYGLTATPYRKHGDEQLLYSYIGNVIATMDPTLSRAPDFEVMVRKTGLQVPFQCKTDQFELLAKVICFDSARNLRIVADILEQVRLDRKVLVLSERKEHLKVLELYLKGQCETLLLTGDDVAAARNSKLSRANEGSYQVLLSTGQLFGEGLDIQSVESLILAFPFSFEGKLIQYTGRLSHSQNPKALIDYHDENITFLDRQFKKRRSYYKKAKIG